MIFLGNILGCIFWGALVAVVATGIVYLLCRLISGSVNSLGAYIVLTVLFILAGAQGSMITGALYLKGYVTDAHDAIESLIPNIDTGDVEQATVNIDQLRQRLLDEYPMLASYIDKIDLSEANNYLQNAQGSSTAIANSVANQFNDTLNYYVLRRVLWLIGFMVAATLVITFFFSYRNNYSTDFTGQSSGGSLQF